MNLPDLVSLPLWLTLLVLAIAVAWYLFQRHFEYRLTRKQAMEEKLAERRQKLYEEFMENFWQRIVAGKLKSDAEKDIGKEFLRKWSHDAWLISSDEVIKGFLRLQAGVDTTGELMIVAARLFVAMRKDMGNPTRLKEREFLRLMIKSEDWKDIKPWLRGRIPDRLLTGDVRTSVADAGADAQVGGS